MLKCKFLSIKIHKFGNHLGYYFLYKLIFIATMNKVSKNKGENWEEEEREEGKKKGLMGEMIEGKEEKKRN